MVFDDFNNRSYFGAYRKVLPIVVKFYIFYKKSSKIFRLSYHRALNQFLKKIKVKPSLDPKSLRIKPRSYWQDFTVGLSTVLP